MSALTATIENDLSVSLLATGIPANVSRVRVTRTTGPVVEVVRGGELDSAGAVSLIDYYPPLERDTTYTITTVTGESLASATVRVESDCGFIRDADNPETKVEVHAQYVPRAGGVFLRHGSFSTRSAHADGRLTPIIGARLGVWTGGRTRATEIQLRLFAEGPDLDRLKALFELPMLCLQTLPDWGLSDPVAYFPADAEFHALRPDLPDAPVTVDAAVLPVRPPLHTPLVVAVLVSTIDDDALDMQLTVSQVDANAAGRNVAEVDLHPQVLLGSG